MWCTLTLRQYQIRFQTVMFNLVLQRLRCQRKEPCRLFTVRKRMELLDEVNTNTLCQCPHNHYCPTHHTDPGTVQGKSYVEENIRTYSGYCFPKWPAAAAVTIDSSTVLLSDYATRRDEKKQDVYEVFSKELDRFSPVCGHNHATSFIVAGQPFTRIQALTDVGYVFEAVFCFHLQSEKVEVSV